MAILTIIFLAVLVAGWLLSACFLWLPARWLGAERPSFLRALLVVSVMNILGVLNAVASFTAVDSFGMEWSGYVSLEFWAVSLILILAAWVMIQRILGAGFGRAVLIWLIHTALNGATAVATVLLLKVFIVNAYVQPTNSMAPTIIGWHQTDPCPLCQGKRIVPGYAPDDLFRLQAPPPEVEQCICSACWKVTQGPPAKQPMTPPDRVLVNQLVKAERWDIVVFRYPREPKQKWIFRLIGLPGETVYLKDGAVWINDVRQDAPADLAGLHYTPIVGNLNAGQGTPEDPIRLGPNECCVLGDFPERCSDSRDWGPVPVENLEGVVSAIYWPPTRWRVFK